MRRFPSLFSPQVLIPAMFLLVLLTMVIPSPSWFRAHGDRTTLEIDMHQYYDDAGSRAVDAARNLVRQYCTAAEYEVLDFEIDPASAPTTQLNNIIEFLQALELFRGQSEPERLQMADNPPYLEIKALTQPLYELAIIKSTTVHNTALTAEGNEELKTTFEELVVTMEAAIRAAGYNFPVPTFQNSGPQDTDDSGLFWGLELDEIGGGEIWVPHPFEPTEEDLISLGGGEIWVPAPSESVRGNF